MAATGQFLQSILDLPEPRYEIHPDTVFEDESFRYKSTKSMTPMEILQQQLLPTVLPCIDDLLKTIRQDNELEREKLNSVNWMVEWLYKNNPRHKTLRENVQLLDIPFVQQILSKRPQPPLPLHLRLTKAEAATLIQAGIRGYIARQRDNVKGFREKVKRKQVAAITIQSAWRGHRIRQAISDGDLSNRDRCNVYFTNKKSPETVGGEDMNATTPQ